MRTHIGHYEVVSELGRGGMGVVYKAYEPALTRYVAIKELSPALAHDQTLVERFLREARSMASLNDPHIIQIYFIGQENSQPFFVMEFVDGESLSTIIKREGRLYVGDALKILHQSAKGLSVAHDRGVIHRDIKPGNLMLNQRGQIKIADFGIALANHDFNSKLTGTGEFVGTPGYLSPEVCLGKMVDQRSDIFALGIVLFETLTGRTPFSDESPLKLMLDVVQSEIPDVREINQEVDQSVADILKKMLAKDPGDRYQSTDTLIADLEKHPLIAQGGTLKLKALPPTGPAATMIGLPTPKTPAPARAPTPPPNMAQSYAPVQAASVPPNMAQSQAPAQAAPLPQNPPPLRQPPPSVDQQQARTRPGVTHASQYAPQKKSSAGKFILVAGVLALGLMMGGAWAVWRMFSSVPNANDMVASTEPATTTVTPDADTQLSSPELLTTQTSATGTSPDDMPNDSGNQTDTPVSTPPEPAVTQTGPIASSNIASNNGNPVTPSNDHDSSIEDGDNDVPEPVQSGGGVRDFSVAVVTNGDPALMIPAQQILEDKLQEQGLTVTGNPKNAAFVIRVKSDRIGSQELSFYGQTATVTSAYLSVSMFGPGGRKIGSTLREKIDYTPLNAEDKVEQAFEGGDLDSLRQAAGK